MNKINIIKNYDIQQNTIHMDTVETVEYSRAKLRGRYKMKVK